MGVSWRTLKRSRWVLVFAATMVGQLLHGRHPLKSNCCRIRMSTQGGSVKEGNLLSMSWWCLVADLLMMWSFLGIKEWPRSAVSFELAVGIVEFVQGRPWCSKKQLSWGTTLENQSRGLLMWPLRIRGVACSGSRG